MNIIYAAKYEGVDLKDATKDILSLFSVGVRSEQLSSKNKTKNSRRL